MQMSLFMVPRGFLIRRNFQEQSPYPAFILLGCSLSGILLPQFVALFKNTRTKTNKSERVLPRDAKGQDNSHADLPEEDTHGTDKAISRYVIGSSLL